jgi:hypothetical protein
VPDALALALACLVVTPPTPGAEEYVFGERETAARTAAMRKALETVPSGVPVTATNRLGAHLSDRRIVYLFPEREQAAWAVVDTRDPWLVAAGERADARLFAVELRGMERDAEWRLILERDGVRVYRRVS